MKANLEPIVTGEDESLYARYFEQAAFDHPLHYHPEIELTYIVRSSGTVMVGDHIGSFGAGDLYLLGSHLPHIFSHASMPRGGAAAEVLHFKAGPAGEPHLSGGEWATFRRLLERARLGIRFDAMIGATAYPLMVAIRSAGGLSRWAYFIQLAQCLLAAGTVTTLASPGYSNTLETTGSERIERVCQYLLEHFREDISHRDLARRFHLAPASLSRAFKRATRKNYQAFLNELRLGHACRLLRESDATITEVCFNSGFQNLSNFNRRFKAAYGCAPREYRMRVGAAVECKFPCKSPILPLIF